MAGKIDDTKHINIEAMNIIKTSKEEIFKGRWSIR
jgi:hypothetical protein